jgi:MoaA/NifB/PqqE/SkfB family radical SAM enzyme
MRDFSDEGTIKKRVNMRGKICLQPFMDFEVHSNGDVRCCSESWMRDKIGNVYEAPLDEIWNGDKIQSIRKTILDGGYDFCDWHQCPFYSNHEHYLFTRDELMNPESLDDVRKARVKKHEKWLPQILRGSTTAELNPANYNFAHDESCNLACPSCRKETIGYVKGEEYENRLAIQNEVVRFIESSGYDNIGRINVTGTGDAFASKVFREFLYTFDGARYPSLDINIQTNGLLFTPRAWDKMSKLHANINEVLISIDACTAPTYAKVRVNGNFNDLLKNLEFLAELNREGKIKRYMLAFVVQQMNYKEMVGAIELSKRLGAERIVFNLLNDWETWTKEEYNEHAIWKSFHPEFNAFMDELKNPLFADEIVDLGNMQQYWEISTNQDVLVLREEPEAV